MFRIAALAALFVTPALAQTDAQPAGQKVRTVDFLKPDQVGGRTVNPSGEFESARRREVGDSLIEVRLSFTDRLVQSAEDI